MEKNNTTIYYATSISEIQSILKNIQGITLAAGCNELVRGQTTSKLTLPQHVLSLWRIPELTTINKTERYIEFGPSITLADIMDLGNKNVPDVLFQALKEIATPAIRTTATLGGHICAQRHRLSLFSPLLALDARLEVHNFQDYWSIPLQRYFLNSQKPVTIIPEFISKIRIPAEQWDIILYKRIGSKECINENSASYTFLAKFQKNILADIRISFAGTHYFRKRELENLLIGKTLPLTEREITILLDKGNLFLEKTFFPPSYQRTCFFKLLEYSLRMLM